MQLTSFHWLSHMGYERRKKIEFAKQSSEDLSTLK